MLLSLRYFFTLLWVELSCFGLLTFELLDWIGWIGRIVVLLMVLVLVLVYRALQLTNFIFTRKLESITLEWYHTSRHTLPSVPLTRVPHPSP